MKEISFAAGECFFTVLWLLARLIVWIRNRRIDWKREALMILMYINLAVIIRFSFFPMERSGGRIQPLLFDPGSVFPFDVNLVPFVHMRDYVSDRAELMNFIGNIAMYIPSGIILPVVYTNLDSFPKTVAAGALICLCVEILQLPLFVRVSDVDDIIMNVTGVIIGWCIYALAGLGAKLIHRCLKGER